MKEHKEDTSDELTDFEKKLNENYVLNDIKSQLAKKGVILGRPLIKDPTKLSKGGLLFHATHKDFISEYVAKIQEELRHKFIGSIQKERLTFRY